MARVGIVVCLCALLCRQGEGRSAGAVAAASRTASPMQAVGMGHETHATASPVETFNEHAKHEVHNMYMKLDYNRNGLFDRHDLPLLVHHYDTDHNGTVDQTEFESNFEMAEPTFAIVTKGLFGQFDANRDNNIDFSDMNAAYDRMDINEDGVVSMREFEEYMTEVTTMIVVLHIQRQEFS